MSRVGLIGFVVLRSARALATLAGLSAVVFFLMSVAPGDPAAMALRAGSGSGHAGISPETVAAFRAEYGLDRPLPVRFAGWLRRAALFDFGRSLQDGRKVSERIIETLPATLALNVPALLLALLLAIPAGIAASRRPGGRFDRVSGLVLDILFASPPFVLGLALLIVFSVNLRIFPIFADPAGGIRGLALPVLALALSTAAPAARVARELFRDAFASASAVAGRARGEDLGAELLRAFRRSAAPLAALVATLLPAAVAGSVLVERLFSLHGTGGLLADAVFSRDTPTVLGLTLLAAAVVVGGSLAADLIAAYFDPRLRQEGEGAAAGPGAW